MGSVRVANFWARMSCPRWNKIRFLRHLARKEFRHLAEKCWEEEGWQKKIKKYKAGDWIIDTYPGPYYHPAVANWEEDDSPEGYNLISDQSGCVIKYSTSYCAWKIFEATGTWPQKTSRERLDSKRWVQFLKEAGYPETTDRPSPNYYYVGVNPDIGEWGLTVWLEEVIDDETVMVSSYVDKKYRFWEIEINDYTWVKICPCPNPSGA